MAANLSTKRAEALVIPPTDFVLVSAAAPTGSGTITLPDGCRGLRVGTAGALNVIINEQNRDGVPMFAGDNPGFFTAVRRDAGNTAANIWAII